MSVAFFCNRGIPRLRSTAVNSVMDAVVFFQFDSSPAVFLIRCEAIGWGMLECIDLAMRPHLEVGLVVPETSVGLFYRGTRHRRIRPYGRAQKVCIFDRFFFSSPPTSQLSPSHTSVRKCTSASFSKRNGGTYARC